jgi:integrase
MKRSNKSKSEEFSIPWEIEEATAGLTNGFKAMILRLRNQDNALIIAKYVLSMKNEVNLSDNYRCSLIRSLTYLSKFHETKPFKQITRDDFISFLNTFRKPEPIDPLHKWIGTYNHLLMVIAKFFRWLYDPSSPINERKKPAVIENLKKLPRREKSIYKPTDLWTQEDDQLFLKYCPSKRERCYHMIAKDTACRPHEILGLRIKDIVFKMSNNRQYAEVMVNGKTGSRPLPLINSIPYVKDWIDDHPQRTNLNAYLIFGMGKSYGKKLKGLFINRLYAFYKKEFFPKLLEDPTVLPEDKVKIKELLNKPWNPYIFRHSALTDKSKILRENVLRQYAGWTINSNMHQKYLHYFGNEANESILEACGLKPKFVEIDKMKPTQCPNCNELNKIDSKFCVKCRMVLSYDAYTETIQDNTNNFKNEIEQLRLEQQKTESRLSEFTQAIGSELSKIVPMFQMHQDLNEQFMNGQKPLTPEQEEYLIFFNRDLFPNKFAELMRKRKNVTQNNNE